MESASVFWVGLDWGNASHAVHAFHPDRTQRCSFSVEQTPQGLRELVSRLDALGTVGGVAVETTHGLVIRALLDAGMTVYPVNPKLSKTWRAARSVAEIKSDGGDARVLAEGLVQHLAHLRPLRLGDRNMRQLAALVEAEKHFIDERTALAQELMDLLGRYHPQMLAFFDDWTVRTAWEFLLAFATPEALAGASKKRLCAFLRARHIGMSPLWVGRIDKRAAALDWPRDKDLEETHVLRAQTLVKMLLALQAQLEVYRKQVESLFKSVEGAELFKSLPGAGSKLAPRLCAMFGEQGKPGSQDKKDEPGVSLEAMRQLSGVAPVTRQSGKKKQVCIRRACRKFWRDTLHLFAHFSKRKSPWARAYYDLCRAKGDTNASALRKLAYKWLAIITRMYKDNAGYDEDKYIASLRRSNSPLYTYMRENHLITP